MKYFFTIFLVWILGGFPSLSAFAQDGEIQEYLTGYEQAEASGDIVAAAKYALALSEANFTGAPLSALEIRNLKADLAASITAGGMSRVAVSLLGRLIAEDQRYLRIETDPVIQSDIRAGLADRLVTLADLYSQLGAEGRALFAYREAHIILQEMSKFENFGLSNNVISPPLSDDKVRTLEASADETIDKYPSKYEGMGDQGTLYVTAKIVALLQRQIGADREAGNNTAAIEHLSLMRFYIKFQCGDGNSACSNWVRGESPPSLRTVNTDLASEWMAFAMPEKSFRDLACSTGDVSDIFSLGLNKRYAKLLAQSWAITGDTEAAATQDYEALSEAKKLLPDVPESDAVHACLIKLQALVAKAAEDKQIRFRPETYHAKVSQTIQSDPAFETLTVFYGTNRNLDNVDKPDKTFGKKRGSLSYGWIEMTVPKDRAIGEVPAPGFLDFGGAKDGVHIVLSRVDRTDDVSVFSSEFANSVAQSDRAGKEAFVFIHGHGVSFASSARRAAQLAVDLDIRNGAAFFSWPAGSVATGYTVSEGNVTALYWRQSLALIKSI